MPENKNKRGGQGRNQGRKPLSTGLPTAAISLRLTQAQRDKMLALGGAAWMRRQIDDAVETETATLSSLYPRQKPR